MSRRSRAVAWYVLLTVLSLVVLFPVYMTLVVAISTPVDYLRAGQPLHPVAPQWGVFANAWTEGDLGRKFALSAVVTAVIVGCQLATSVCAAYAFAFLRFPGRQVLFAVFTATLLLPLEVTLLPNIDTVLRLGWLNSVQGLAVPFLATAFGTFLIRQGFLGIPRDLRDAARLDGLSHLQVLWRVAIPLTRPVIASFGVVAFLSAWNQYTWPRAVITEERWETVQIGLKSLSAATVEQGNVGPAAAVIAALPVLALLIVLQKQLIRGLTAGAVKG